MATVLSVIPIAFIAICGWLGVRIFTRHERWAKWTLVAVVELPVLYVASFGPACWIVSRTVVGLPAFRVIYIPIDVAVYDGPDDWREFIEWYGELFIREFVSLHVGMSKYAKDQRADGPDLKDFGGWPIDDPNAEIRQ